MKHAMTLFSFVWMLLIIIPETTIINKTLGNGIFAIFTLFFLSYISYKEKYIKIVNDRFIFLLLIVITGIFFYHTIRSQVQYNYQYFYILYVVVPVLITVYIFPNYIRISEFKQFAAISGSALVLIAVPAHLFGEYTILWFEVRLAENVYHPDRMTSIFEQSGNQFAPLLLVSVIASVDLFYKRANKIWIASFVISFIGLVATNSRTGISGIFLGFVIYIIVIKGPQWTIGATVGAVVTATLATLVFVFNVRPWPSLVEIIGFEARREIWEAAASSMHGNHLFGHGLVGSTEAYGNFLDEPKSAHNGYVNSYVATGIVGILSYLCLYIYSIIKNYSTTLSPFCLSLLFVFLYWQIFNGAWLMTNEMEGIIMAILIGYALHPHIN